MKNFLSSSRFQLWQLFFLIIFLFLVLIFYLWTASTSYGPPFYFNFGKNIGKIGGGYNGQFGVDYYNALSDAFLAGKLHLLIKPHPKLLALPDPYDPRLNGPYRLHDASLYHGKYYLYFGPAPALILFIPFKSLTGYSLPSNLAVALFGFGGVLFSVALLVFLVKKFLPETPFSMVFLGIVALSLDNFLPFILRRPEVYEVAIAAGYFFVWAGVFQIMRGVLGEEKKYRFFFSGSLFLGLAVVSRYHLVLVFVALLIFLYLFQKIGLNQNILAGKIWITLLLPFFSVIFMLGFYNFLRFGNFFDLSGNYQLAAHVARNIITLKVRMILPGLFYYFLQSPRILKYFPFFQLSTSAYPLGLPAGYMGTEGIIGLLWAAPFVNILWFLPLVWCRLWKVNKHLLATLLFFLLSAVLLVVFLCYFSSFVTMRYEVDFASLVILTALLVWFWLDGQIKNRQLKYSLRIVFVFLVIFAILLGVMISFCGYYNLLAYSNPRIYFYLSDFFNKITNIGVLKEYFYFIVRAQPRLDGAQREL
jgi:hypothetical protein